MAGGTEINRKLKEGYDMKLGYGGAASGRRALKGSRLSQYRVKVDAVEAVLADGRRPSCKEQHVMKQALSYRGYRPRYEERLVKVWERS